APKIDERDGRRWMTLELSFYNHVQATWAFAMASAVAMVDRVEAGDRTTIDALNHPMARPNSYLSYDLLRDTGTDPVKPEMYQALMRRMSRDMDIIEGAPG